MTFPRDPTTGLTLQFDHYEAPIPGTLPNTAAEPAIHAALENTTMDERTINEVYRAILRHTWAGIAAGERVLWPGFATFERVWTPPKPGRNPQTGDYLNVPGFWRIKITAAKKLQNMIGG